MTVAYGSLPFAEQIQFFRAKTNVPTSTYLDVYNSEHDWAFMVAGANRNDLLADFREAVDNAIANGGTLEQFRADFDDIVARHGWAYNGGRNWRSRVIYQTNLYSSYNAGRLQQQTEMIEYLPYWEYRHGDSQHPRPTHLSWHGKVLPATDPWWQHYYPVNAYGCQCSVIAHSREDVERLGLKITDTPTVEWESRTIGVRSNPQVVQVPVGIDPGFEHAPGASRLNSASKLAFGRSAQMPPDFGSAAASNLLQQASIIKLLNKETTAMVDDLRQTGRATGASKSIAALPTAVVSALLDNGEQLYSAVVAIKDQDLLAGLQNHGLPLSVWQRLPELLAAPKAILQDGDTLLYVIIDGNQKMLFEIEAGSTTLNKLKRGELLGTERIKSLKHSNLLSGSLDGV